MNDVSGRAEAGVEPVLIPTEAYTSEAYARAENEKLWGKVWQVACRVEEIPKAGDYVTYDILDESIIVVRSGKDRIQAFYNVCQHRGRRLTEGCGHTGQFICRFHGWRWDLTGGNTFVLDREDWGEALTEENLRLKPVKAETWGGWVWINMDPDCQPLNDYLEPAVSMLDPYEFEKMRYRWRAWTRVPCNWKTALEAFNESYHVDGSHPQFALYGSTKWWCKAEYHCAWHGRGAPRDATVQGASAATGELMGQAGQDPRLFAAAYQNELVATLNAGTTETFVKVANRLKDVLPPEATFDEVNAYFIEAAQADDAARGVIWPTITPQQMSEAGLAWHIFPNSVILFGYSFLLGYRARPDGDDPDSCIFEIYVIERFPEGEEPKTEWVFKPELTEEAWLKILAQDFANMPQVQKGMKSRGFQGPRPGPRQELSVIHFHRLLAKYMGTGAPQPLE